jgi:Respiratory nitrate reductase alpha N-terminal
MSHFLERLTYLSRKREAFADGHGELRDEDRTWEEGYRQRLATRQDRGNVAPLKTGKTAETSTTGREGLVNVGAIMSDDQSLHRTVVHVSGDGTRISIREFQELQARLPVLRRKLNAYSRAFLSGDAVRCLQRQPYAPPALRSMAVEVSRPCRR